MLDSTKLEERVIRYSSFKDNSDFGMYSATASGYLEPAMYKHMLKRPEAEKERLIDGCAKEIKKMKLKDAWVIINLSELPKEHLLLKCKGVFESKRGDTYGSRLVTMGFIQVPGVDFTYSFSPIVSNVVVCILLILCMMYGWDTKMIDVEQTFLYGILDLKKLHGNARRNKSTPGKLTKSIYGLVQTYRIFWKTI